MNKSGENASLPPPYPTMCSHLHTRHCFVHVVLTAGRNVLQTRGTINIMTPWYTGGRQSIDIMTGGCTTGEADPLT